MIAKDLYTNEWCEDVATTIFDSIVSFIRADGFDISKFSLISVENSVWEFVSDNEKNRGFLLFYDPNKVKTPIAQYQVHNGNVYFSFNARNITEAYVQHNREISDADYVLLSRTYSETEEKVEADIKRAALKYSCDVVCDIYNCTPKQIHELSGSSIK